MKRIFSIFCIVGIMFASVNTAQALDVKTKGVWDFNFEYLEKSFIKGGDGSARFSPRQRLRTQVDIIASENLKGVVFFELGKTTWGKAVQGASLGTDGNNVIKLRYSYVDWVIPNSMVTFRMGLQPFILPGYVSGSTVLDDDGAGITISSALSETVGVSLFWVRAQHSNFGMKQGNLHSYKNDSLDFFGLTVPMVVEDFKITPWGMCGLIGKSSLFGDSSYGDIQDIRAGMLPVLPWGYAWNNPSGISTSSPRPFGTFPSKNGNAWWAGVTAELAGSSPFRIAFDVNYGAADLGDVGSQTIHGVTQKFELKREGWFVSLLTEYRLDFLTPGIMGWYSSGDDDKVFEGSKMMPTVYGNWSATSFGYSGGYAIDTDGILGNNTSGSWGAIVYLKDLSFMDNLKHTIRGGRFQGTNDKKAPELLGIKAIRRIRDHSGSSTMLYLTTADYAWEANFDSEYRIYEGLTMAVELSYIRIELDKSVWHVSDLHNKNAYRVGLNVQYLF